MGSDPTAVARPTLIERRGRLVTKLAAVTAQRFSMKGLGFSHFQLARDRQTGILVSRSSTRKRLSLDA